MIRRLSRTISTTSELDEISASYDVPVVDPSSVPKVLYGHRASMDSLADPEWSQESRVLVLYTGGTIGMMRNDRGRLVPIPHEMETNIRRYPHMHDEVYAEKRCSNSFTQPLILPECQGERRRVAYWVYEYDPLLDSSNMTMDDWIRVAKDIKEVYELFDGFVVLHGTDTLSYTAAALSFMLENLGKPVVITGSQIPLFETRSDGRDNFISSLIMAGSYTIPEVAVFFNNKLYRGNRTTKVSTGSLQAFDSPNMAPLATAGIIIHVDYRSIFRPTSLDKFRVFDRLNRHVGLLRIFPSISVETVRAFLQPPMAGVVLQTYGAGNMPSNRTDIMEVLRAATQRGVIIINITQCMHGAVDAIYETGQALVDSGVMAGMDMTPEAALTKLSYVLAKKEWSLDYKRKMMKTNLRGEMTCLAQEEGGLVMEEGGGVRELDVIASISRALQLASAEDVDQVKDLLLPAIFFAAVVNVDITRLHEIYKNGVEINMQDASGWTGLHIASSEGLIEAVTWLLQHGASVHIRDKMARTPLTLAIDNDHHEVIPLLVKTGSYLFESSLKLGEALVTAAASDNLRRLKSYQLAGVDLGLQDACGRSALHVACTVGSEEVVGLLLAAGVPVDEMDRTDLTPAMCAKINHHTHILELMEKHKLNNGLPG